MATRGRKAGSFMKGSLPWHAQRLAVGGVMLIPDNGAARAYQQQQLDLALTRLARKVQGTWTVQACYGLRASDMLAAPFKFYRIERVA